MPRDEAHRTDVTISEGSVLYISAHIEPTHENYDFYRPGIDPPPDYDLNRIIESARDGTRRWFQPRILDAPSGECVYPESPDGISAVVVAGSLYYCSRARGPLAAWQEELIAFVRKIILEWDLGYLGLCGGGQIGLCALGGTVKRNPAGVGSPADLIHDRVLVRTGELLLTSDGRADPIFADCPDRFDMQEAHGDCFAGIPDGARVLARSADLPKQVLGWGDRVRLFQPHPELSRSFLRRVFEGLARRSDSPKDTKHFGQIGTRLRETKIANERIIPNFLRML